MTSFRFKICGGIVLTCLLEASLFVCLGDSNGQDAKAVLDRNCITCHGASQMSGLDLRQRETMLKGGKRGPAIVPGKAASSLLYQSLSHQAELKMPPGKEPISQEEREVLRKWIDGGAPWTTLESSTEQAALMILTNQCIECHGANQTSGLDLRSRETAMKGGNRGPALIPGRPEQSLLYQSILRQGELKMPMGRAALPTNELEVLRNWIMEGAPWSLATGPEHRPEPSWWSFKKLHNPPVPRLDPANQTSNPIDAFVLAKLEEKGLKPAPKADKRTLIRRAYFDLIGLPPTPDQVDQFLKDSSPDAFEKVIDMLLSSPQYGERWGRHWLDVVRYADSAGFEGDVYYPNAWRYRDYVIKSFNDDKPYDRFVQEQIAGDELWPDNMELKGFFDVPYEKLEHMEARIGTSLYTFGQEIQESQLDASKLRYERLTDAVDTTAAAFLGLTFNCARCHDHKFDPISQKDYFQLQAIFATSTPVVIPVVTGATASHRDEDYFRMIALDEGRKAYLALEKNVKDRVIEAKKKDYPTEVVQAFEIPKDKRTAQQTELATPLVKFSESIKVEENFTPQEKALREKLSEDLVKSVIRVPQKDVSHSVRFDGFFDLPSATVLGHIEPELLPDVYVLERGDFGKYKSKVGPALPAVLLSDEDPEKLTVDSAAPRYRKQLALWLTRPDHPLTARVMVNRVWQGHFGQGIVSTTNDFGRQGQRPSHPELLDWLAHEFVEQDWSLKSLHRLIMLSDAYQRDSRFASPEDSKIDPGNVYLWRMNRQRLEAEAVWDSVHAVAGNLNLKMGGRPIMPPLSVSELTALRIKDVWVTPSDLNEGLRRGVYILSRRNFMFPLFDKFDRPDPSQSCPRRDMTTVAPQALWSLNNYMSYRQAQQFAARLVRDNGSDPSSWINAAWRIALARPPSTREVEEALSFMKGLANENPAKGGDDEQPKEFENHDPAQMHALTELCLTVLNLNEFVFID